MTILLGANACTIRAATILLAVLAFGACSSGKTVAPDAAASDCSLGPIAGELPDTLRILVGRNQLPLADTRTIGALGSFQPMQYETAFGIDCHNDLTSQSGISAVLRPGIGLEVRLDSAPRLADGSPATPMVLADQWQSALNSGIPIDSIRADDRSRLNVFSPLSSNTTMSLLADPLFAVRIGPYRVGDEIDDTVLKPTIASSSLPAVVLLHDVRDLRDVLSDGSIDVALTSDADALDFVRLLPGWSAAELRTGAAYVFVSASRLPTGPDHQSETPLKAADQSLLRELSDRAIQKLTRPYESDVIDPSSSIVGFPPSCGSVNLTPSNPPAPRRRSSKIVFENGDQIAEDIAARIVALLRSNPVNDSGDVIKGLFPGLVLPEKNAISFGLTESDYSASISDGSDLAYLVRLEGSPLQECAAILRLASSTPWIAAGIEANRLFIVPLVRERTFAVFRSSIGRYLVQDAFGNIRLIVPEIGDMP